MNIENLPVKEGTTPAATLGSHFPAVVQDSLQRSLAKTPHGCGGCVHAEWVLNTREKFAVGCCRAGIKLEHVQESEENGGVTITTSLLGYDPVDFCTAQNVDIGEK